MKESDNINQSICIHRRLMHKLDDYLGIAKAINEIFQMADHNIPNAAVDPRSSSIMSSQTLLYAS